jgi:hypothetical protein
MLLPKKLDEESKVRNQDASIDKWVGDLEVLCWLVGRATWYYRAKSRWNCAHIERAEPRSKEQIFRLGRRNKKAKEDMHNFEYLVKVFAMLLYSCNPFTHIQGVKIHIH